MTGYYIPQEIWSEIISYNKVILKKDRNLNTELHWAAVCNDIPKTTKEKADERSFFPNFD